MDAYEVYRGWFRHHYGREFACTREQWDEWCKRDNKLHYILPDQEEIDRERREGWAYGDVR